MPGHPATPSESHRPGPAPRQSVFQAAFPECPAEQQQGQPCPAGAGSMTLLLSKLCETSPESTQLGGRRPSGGKRWEWHFLSLSALDIPPLNLQLTGKCAKAKNRKCIERQMANQHVKIHLTSLIIGEMQINRTFFFSLNFLLCSIVHM